MSVSASPPLIMRQFLEWVAARPRRREDVLDAWASSCPRFPVWEDARADGLIRMRTIEGDGRESSKGRERRVELTARGRAMLAKP